MVSSAKSPYMAPTLLFSALLAATLLASPYAAAQSPPTNPTPPGILPLSGAGIRYLPSVGGKGEADLALRYYPKPDNWGQDLRAMCSARKESLASATEQLEKDSSLMSPDAALNGSPLDQIERHYALANLYAYQGLMNKSVAEWESSYGIAEAQLPGAMPELEEVLGTAYLLFTSLRWITTSTALQGNRCISSSAARGTLPKERCFSEVDRISNEIYGPQA